MSRDRDLKRNGSGCLDLTAYEAIRHIECESGDVECVRFHTLLDSIFELCDKSGYRIKGRIVLEDKKTGRIHR